MMMMVHLDEPTAQVTPANKSLKSSPHINPLNYYQPVG